MDIDVILDTRASADELATLGRLAEQAGVRGVWVSSLLDSRDPFANLTVLARESESLLLGPVAVNPFDTHPVRIAVEDAQDVRALVDVVPGRAHVDSRRAQGAHGGRVHPGPVHHVLRVGHDEVDARLGAELRQPRCQHLAAGRADHVPQAQDAHPLRSLPARRRHRA